MDFESLKDNRISVLIPRQVPSFVRDSHPKFITFLQKYFEWMEENDGAVEEIKQLLELQDVDTTEDRLLIQFHKELAGNIPFGVLNDKRTLYKNIRQFHRARGTEKSFQALFRFLYNDEIDFYYPYVDILRTSDGIWVVNKTLRVLAQSGDPFALVDKRIFGIGSGTSAVVERVLKYQTGIFPVYELFLNPKTIEDGTFSAGEIAHTEDDSIRVKLYWCVTGVNITDPGVGYSEGDEITVSGGSGIGCRLQVGSVGPNGEIKAVDIIDPGVNYSTAPTITFAPTADTAAGTAIKGALITYPGFYLNENGFLSTTKYLQDSFFYQQFSYVLKTNQSINLYKEIVSKVLHPAGRLLFGSVFIDSPVSDPVKHIPWSGGSGNSIARVVIFWNLKDVVKSVSPITKICLNINLPDAETSAKLGPTYDWLDRFKFAAYPHDPNFDVSRVVPGVRLWVKANSGVTRDEANRVSHWKNLAFGANASGGFVDPTSVAERPIITRSDNKENLVRRSQVFSKGAWNSTGVAILDGVAISPDLIQNAAEITCSAGNTKHQISQDSAAMAADLAEAGQSYQICLRVKKAATARYVWIGDTGDSSVHSATFDLDNAGAVVGSQNTTTTMAMALGNGWYKIVFEFTRTAAGSFVITFGINNTGHTNGTPETWNAAGSERIYIHAAQVRNLLADDAYIPTFEGCEVRGYNGRELLRFDGNNDYMESYETLGDVIDADTGVVYVAFFLRGIGTNAATLIENEAVIQDLNQKLGLYLKSSGNMYLYHDDGSGDSVSQPVSTGNFYVAVLRHTGGVIDLQHNDTLPKSSASSGDTGSVAGKLRIGWSTGTGGGGGGTGDDVYLPHIPQDYLGGMFPDDGGGGGGGGSPGFAKVSIGEIIILDKVPNAKDKRIIEDYLKNKWLNIPYRAEEHWMSAPNEDYWDDYANFQLQQRGELILDDIISHPKKSTTLSHDPYLIAREVISDFTEIKVDLQPQYEVLRDIDVAGGNKVNWIREQRRNILRFEPGGAAGTRPVFAASDANFGGMPSLSFTSGSSQWLKSLSKSSDVLTASVLMGKVIVRTTSMAQSNVLIVGDSLSPYNWALKINSGNFVFETRNGSTTTSVTIAGSANTTYLVTFKLTGGIMSIRLDLGTAQTVGSVGNVSNLDSNIYIGGNGTAYATVKIGRIILANMIPSAPNEAIIDNILLQKYGIA